MRTVILAVSLACVVTAASAQGRPDARTMTCEQVQRTIDQRGAAVLTTGRHTYDRFVSRRNRCDYPFVHERTRISTRDTDRCAVYVCRQSLMDDLPGWNN